MGDHPAYAGRASQIHRVGARHHQAQDGVSALVVGDALLVGAAQEEWALGPEHNLLERVQKVLLTDVVLLSPGRQ